MPDSISRSFSEKAIATACANIALVKYWGKRDEKLNLPRKGSLSVTLDALRTITEVELLPLTDPSACDALMLDSEPTSGKKLERVSRFLDLVRETAKSTRRARVVSSNTFPAASGLASSASGFAALAVAAARAYGLDPDARSLSLLARRGSGSAARSIFGGIVRMHAGTLEDGSDAFAEPFIGAKLELHSAIAVAVRREKAVGSTEGMELTRMTSPYHSAWLDTIDRDLADAEDALRTGDIDKLANVVEASCLAMHANAMAARPGLLYFSGATLWAIERIRALRRTGTPVFFTVDAGPHVVAFTLEAHLGQVKAALKEHADFVDVVSSPVGEDAHLVGAPAPRTL
jgi:diphosphomevalonate decarboxylase